MTILFPSRLVGLWEFMADNQCAFMGLACMRVLQSYRKYRASDWTQVLPQCAHNNARTGPKQRCKTKAKRQEDKNTFFVMPCKHFMCVIFMSSLCFAYFCVRLFHSNRWKMKCSYWLTHAQFPMPFVTCNDLLYRTSVHKTVANSANTDFGIRNHYLTARSVRNPRSMIMRILAKNTAFWHRTCLSQRTTVRNRARLMTSV